MGPAIARFRLGRIPMPGALVWTLAPLAIVALAWHAVTLMPSFSISRVRIEYGGCSQTKRSRPRFSATHCASTIWLAGNVEDPM